MEYILKCILMFSVWCGICWASPRRNASKGVKRYSQPGRYFYGLNCTFLEYACIIVPGICFRAKSLIMLFLVSQREGFQGVCWCRRNDQWQWGCGGCSIAWRRRGSKQREVVIFRHQEVPVRPLHSHPGRVQPGPAPSRGSSAFCFTDEELSGAVTWIRVARALITLQ